MGGHIIETVLGAVVLLVAGFFLAFALKTADASHIQGYLVTANFPRADGLKTGSDVMINGVKVGTVLDQKLLTEPGKDQFLVRITLTIDPKVLLPVDTVATIANESLLGGRYLSLEIGVEDDTISTDGKGRIIHTQPPLRLDDLIGKLMFSTKSDEKKEPAKESQPHKSSLEDNSLPAPKAATIPTELNKTLPAEPDVATVSALKTEVGKKLDDAVHPAVDTAKKHTDTKTWYDLQKSGALNSGTPSQPMNVATPPPAAATEHP